MRPIKTLVIAPYEGLKDIVNEVAEEIPGLDVDTYVADMLKGVDAAKAKHHDGYDAIISRAGTADLIREITDLPVTDIKLSVIDMMRAIRLAQNYAGRFVIVGFKTITEQADNISQLIDYPVSVRTIMHINEIDACLAALKETGVSLIVGDMVTVTRAKKMGFNTILVTSGKESVKNAFEEVINIHSLLRKRENEQKILKRTLQNKNIVSLCYNVNKELLFNSDEGVNADIAELKAVAESLLEQLIVEEKITAIKKVGEETLLFRGERFDEEELFLVFSIEQKPSVIKPADESIVFINSSEVGKGNFDMFTASNNQMKTLIEQGKVYAKTSSPILLIGERGTGKNALAHAIYRHSEFEKSPLVIIDAAHMTEKRWRIMTESENSLFSETGFTFFIKDLHLMNESSQQLIASYIRNTYVHKRNRFIFSAVPDKLDNGFLHFIRYTLNALPLMVPGLNERKEDIASLSSVFLSDIIPNYGKQILGFEKDAIECLQDFQWTDHLDQLKRVVEQLIILTGTYFITRNTVEIVLKNEETSLSSVPNQSAESIDTNKTLDEIMQDVINQVLAEEDYNQSKAAARLGISRSTLWRKIK